MIEKKADFEQLAGAYGYGPVNLKAGSPMWSFLNDDSKIRINYYFTTGSLTAQAPRDPDHFYGKMIVNVKHCFTEAQFEEVLQKIDEKIKE